MKKNLISMSVLCSVGMFLFGMDDVPLKELYPSPLKKYRAVYNPNEKIAGDIIEEEWRAGKKHHLDLQNKGLTSVDDIGHIFGSIPSVIECDAITKLFLSNNKLKELSPELFAPLCNLIELHARKNCLTSVDFGSWFNACPRLKYMNFRDNQIDKVAWSNHPRWGHESIEFQLPVIDLKHNNVAESDQQQLIVRYKKELKRITDVLYPVGKEMVYGTGCASGAATSAAFLTPFILMCAGVACSNPLFDFIWGVSVGSSGCVGCVTGTAYGVGSSCACRSNIHQDIENTTPPIYFDDEKGALNLKFFLWHPAEHKLGHQRHTMECTCCLIGPGCRCYEADDEAYFDS